MGSFSVLNAHIVRSSFWATEAMFEARQAYCWHISMRPSVDFYRDVVAFERLDSELQQSHRPTIFPVHPFWRVLVGRVNTGCCTEI